MEIEFPQASFEKHLAEIRKSPEMGDSLDLIPTE